MQPARARLGLAVAIAVLLSLGAGLALKGTCSTRPWQGDWQYAHYCYSDIVPLFDGKDLREDRLPYVDVANEYPVLTGAFMAGVAALTDGMPGYVWMTFVLLTLVGAAASLGMWRLRLDPPRILAWALAPPLLIHGLTNWDLIAVALAVWGCVAWRAGHPFTAALLFGLGGSAKLYPAFFLPFLLVAAWRLQPLMAPTQVTFGGPIRARLRAVLAPLALSGRPDARRVVLGGLVGFGLPNLLVAAFAWENWRGIWLFHARRTPDFETPWAATLQPLGEWLAPGAMTPETWRAVAGLVGFALMLAALALLGRKTWGMAGRRLDPLAAGGLLTLTFLLVTKVYSPQYTLWALPILLLLNARAGPLLLFLAADAATFLVRYQLLSNVEPGGHAEWDLWSRLAVNVRWLALAWCTGGIAMQLGLARPVRLPRLLRLRRGRQRPTPTA